MPKEVLQSEGINNKWKVISIERNEQQRNTKYVGEYIKYFF